MALITLFFGIPIFNSQFPKEGLLVSWTSNWGTFLLHYQSITIISRYPLILVAVDASSFLKGAPEVWSFSKIARIIGMPGVRFFALFLFSAQTTVKP